MASTQKPLSFSLGPLNTKYILDLVAKQKLINSRYNRSIYMDDLITDIRTKAEAKPKAKTELKVFNELEYDNFPDNLHMYAWQEWIAFRKKAGFKKYKTDATMKKLAKMGSPEEQQLIVQQSIDNEYQGLFALKGNNNGQSQKSSQKLSAYERQVKRNDELYRQSNECELGVGASSGHLGRTVDKGERGEALIELDKGTFVDY